MMVVPTPKILTVLQLLLLLLLLLLGLFLDDYYVSATKTTECPQPDLTLKTMPGGKSSDAKYKNKTPIPLVAFWLTTSGEEKLMDNNVSGHGGKFASQTSVGHVFRFYYDASSSSSSSTTTTDQEPNNNNNNYIFVKERIVTNTPKDRMDITIDDLCDDILNHYSKKQEEQRILTDIEMKSLLADPNEECLPKDDSTKWSCVNILSAEEYQERLKKYPPGTRYGFATIEEATPPDKHDKVRNIGDTQDTVWLHQVPKIPRVVAPQSPGYQKMDYTQKMKDLLLEFYETHKKGGIQDSVTPARIIPGGFTNSHTVPMSMLSLDKYPKLKSQLIQEMQRILEWWTQKNLVPTSTFGIRIYHNQSMLINHVDRADTHVASAVIQVGQDNIEEGWPLEVLHSDGSCSEVYLQPGQLVLYEGARFLHGRPMRLQGEDFANIFSHFRPSDWYGPGKSPNYDGMLDENGYVIIDNSGEDDEDENTNQQLEEEEEEEL